MKTAEALEKLNIADPDLAELRQQWHDANKRARDAHQALINHEDSWHGTRRPEHVRVVTNYIRRFLRRRVDRDLNIMMDLRVYSADWAAQLMEDGRLKMSFSLDVKVFIADACVVYVISNNEGLLTFEELRTWCDETSRRLAAFAAAVPEDE